MVGFLIPWNMNTGGGVGINTGGGVGIPLLIDGEPLTIDGVEVLI